MTTLTDSICHNGLTKENDIERSEYYFDLKTSLRATKDK